MKIQKIRRKDGKVARWLGICFFLTIFLSSHLSISSLSAFSLLKDITVKSDAAKDIISISVNAKTKYNIFPMSKPDRIVIDLNDCEHDASKKKDIAANTQFITDIRSGQFKNEPVKTARIVVELKKSAGYSATATDTNITVTLTAKQTDKESKPATIPEPKKPQEPAVTTPKKPETAKPKEATPSKTAKTATGPLPNIPDKEHLALVKEIKEDEIKTPAAKEKPVKKTAETSEKKPEKTKKTDDAASTLPKDLVTLDFTDADIKDVLQILAVKTGMNIIYGDDVEGKISLHLENVPFDEAMNLILQMQGLVLQRVASNVLRVMTPDVLKKERADAVQSTQIFPLSYARADELGGKIMSVMTSEGQKVAFQSDARTNSIIATTTPEGLLRVATLIKQLDTKPEQVLIEAKIVEILITDSDDIGIDWSLTRTAMGQSDSRITETAQSGTASQSMTGSFQFGYLRSDVMLTARLAAAQAKGNASILSQPRIATLNNQVASIMVGDQIPYKQTTVSDGIATETILFRSVGIQLTVTPTINADGRITMTVRPEVSYPALGGAISTRNAQTTVIVKNGETIVIGGLIRENESKDLSQIPLLGDLPVLGHFFKSQHSEQTKTELLVFVTPYVMKE